MHDATTLGELRRQVASLERKAESRDVIGMAKGILIARTGCSPDQAFEILSRQSQHEKRKVVDIAREVVEQSQRRY